MKIWEVAFPPWDGTKLIVKQEDGVTKIAVPGTTEYIVIEDGQSVTIAVSAWGGATRLSIERPSESS